MMDKSLYCLSVCTVGLCGAGLCGAAAAAHGTCLGLQRGSIPQHLGLLYGSS
jgi:hypothetical protein